MPCLAWNDYIIKFQKLSPDQTSLGGTLLKIPQTTWTATLSIIEELSGLYIDIGEIHGKDVGDIYYR